MRSPLAPACAAVLLAYAPAAAQQGTRAPNAAEAAVLSRVVAAITRALDQCGDSDWEKTSDDYEGHVMVAVAPQVPMDLDQDFEREYAPRRGGHLWRTVIQPLEQQLQAAMTRQDLAAAQRIGVSLRSQNRLTVSVNVNLPALDADTTSGVERVAVPGVPLAFREPADSSDLAAGPTYRLAFGDWRTAPWDDDERAFQYHFAHAPGTPWIENAVVVLKGSEDRIKTLLRRIDWTAFGAAVASAR